MIETWSQGDADANMDEGILVELGDIIQRHPWWRARARLTLSLLERLNVRPPARILDAGCGWGVTLDALECAGYRATGADISRRILERLDRPGRRLAEADLTKPIRDATAMIEPFDAVLALDVIEHLDDDRAAVAQLAQFLRPGGLAIISVPALPDLFTEFDAIQGHRRRYTPETLRAAFADSTLRVERVFWWGQWLVPILQRQRRRPRSRSGESPSEIYRRYLRLPAWPLPHLLALGFRFEHARALNQRLTRGTSLFATATRI